MSERSEAQDGRIVEFAIGGMTCAACSARLEKVLNRQAGIEASVNLASERARVRLSAGADEGAVIAAVAKAGFSAQVADSRTREAAKGVAYTAHVHVGQPAEVIAKVAEELAARMIVMGTHGRTGVVGLVMGSVASRVVHLAPCPVLLIK